MLLLIEAAIAAALSGGTESATSSVATGKSADPLDTAARLRRPDLADALVVGRSAVFIALAE